MNCNFLNGKMINILTENANGEMYVLEADSLEELFADWNNECAYVPSNDEKIYFASYNGNVVNPDLYTNFENLLKHLATYGKKVKNTIIPVDVCIKRYYRAYAHVNEDATDEEIRKIVMENIIENQDNELSADPDFEIEEDDIQYINIDREGSWSEQDDKEITEILKRLEK